MPQYQNEYEGFGNALMNIGSMYYSQEEKKKEEERLRKEKEDERKYLATQAEVEWNRRKPIEEYKQALALARQASTEAERNRPRYFNSGSERITQMRVPDGKGGFEFVEGREPIKEQPRAQRERSPFVEVGSNLVDTRTMKVVYEGEKPTTKGSGGVTQNALMGQSIKLAEDQATLDATPDYVLTSKMTTREAVQKGIDARKAALSAYTQPPAPPAQTGPVPEGVLGALMKGWQAAGKGSSIEAATGAAFDGSVTPQVAADSASSIVGEPVKVNGVAGTPNATGKKPKAEEAAPTKEVPPFSDMVAAFVKQKKRQPDAKEEAALRKKYEAWLAANKE